MTSSNLPLSELAATTAEDASLNVHTHNLHTLNAATSSSSSAASSCPDTLSAWTKALSELKQSMSGPVFDAYLGALRFGSFDSENATMAIAAPSLLVKSQVEEKYKDSLESQLRKITEIGSLRLTLHIDSNPEVIKPQPFIIVKRPEEASQKTAISSSSASYEPLEPNNINPKYTFESFVVGNSNQFCHAAALQVAEKPGVSYNPLFIYGGVGLGKTHLLHAIGNKILAERPSAKVLYLSSEAFTNELILALRNSKMDEFKAKMRAIEVLLIDDIQFMVGKERTQEEFFHTFNALYSARHQIVISSDKIPSDIPQIEERLYTRFSWGLIADIQSPDFETRVAILNRKAHNENFELPQDVAHLIADKVSSNVRELEGALTRLHAVSSLQKIKISEELATNCLKHLFTPKKVNISVDDIKKAVAVHFSLKVSEIISKRRTKNLSFPRHIAMYLCRKHTTCSYPEIGSHFGGRDHSSVIHAASVVSAKLKSDPEVRKQVGDIEKALLSSN
jgi:chromosomal replication initiator protein